jgi:alpha-mannosidase
MGIVYVKVYGVNNKIPTTADDSTMKVKTLYMIGNAHIDPVWLWRWHEGMQEIKATFRSALDRLSEYEDFVFTASSSAFYAWIEENEPDMFAEIKARVAEGRWEFVGGWWIEPDCNIPGGEALVRQGLYGQRYLMSRFGKHACVGYNPDSFGHNAMLPQILKRSGIDYYVFMRPGPHENDALHQVFWWEADDCSRVLAYRIPYSYTAWGNQLDAHIRRCGDDIPDSLDSAMCFYGVGNHGGGPTRQNIDRILTLNDSPDFPKLVFSTVERYFETTLPDKKIPVVHGELQHHASGCYSAHSGIKRRNRQAENTLLVAEKWGAMAQWITGVRYPKEALEKAWKCVLFNQFHDILAGTSVESAYEDADRAYSNAIDTADRVSNAAFQKIAWRIATSQEQGRPLIVFNPHAWSCRVPVEVELGWFEQTAYNLVDASCIPVTSQQVHPLTSLIGSTRICFVADLPALGYHTYYLIPVERNTNSLTSEANYTVTEWQNPWFRLTLAAEKGIINALYDIANGCNVFNGPACQAIVIDDPSDTWSHGVLRYDREVAAFTGNSIEVMEHGAVKTTIRVTSRYRESSLVQDFTLYEAIPRIDVHVTVDWHEHFKALKLCFPLNVVKSVATFEIPYGHINRPLNGEEQPGQSWVDVSGTNPDNNQVYGLSLLNDGKYSFSIEGNELRLTVLRSPIYAHHQPYEPDPAGNYSFMDQGIQHFTYALLPHIGTWQDANTVQQAMQLNQPAFILKETYHPWGNLPQRQSLISASPDNITITAIKIAEDNDDLIVRCYETHSIKTKASLNIIGREDPIEVDFLPCEIKTLRIPSDHISPVKQANLLELNE